MLRRPRPFSKRRFSVRSGKAFRNPEPPTGNDVVIYPIQPVLLRWAHRAHEAKAAAGTFLRALRDVENLAARAGVSISVPQAAEEVDEEALYSHLVEVRARAGQRGGGADVQNLIAAITGLLPQVGSIEELRAVEPMPSFGVLNDPKLTQALTGRYDAALYQGKGWPVLARGNELFVVMGPDISPTGRELLPVAGPAALVSRVAAGIDLFLLSRLWAGTGFRPGSVVRFVVPQESPSADQLMQEICVPHSFYRSTDNTAQMGVGVSFDQRTLVGRIETKEGGSETGAVIFQGRLDDKEKVYRLKMQGPAATLSFGGKTATFSSEGKKLSFQLIRSLNVCPGDTRAAGYFPPPILSWLRSGIESLAADVRDRKGNAKAVQAALNGADPERILMEMRGFQEALSELPMKVQEVERSGAYFGGEPRQQSLAALRYFNRSKMSLRPNEEPPTFLHIVRRAKMRDKEFINVGREAERLRSGLTMVRVLDTDLDASEGEEEVSTRPIRKPRNIVYLPLASNESPVKALVGTVWGPLVQDGKRTEYRPLWQGFIELEELEQKAANLDPAAVLRHLILQRAMPSIRDAVVDATLEMPLSLVVVALVDTKRLGPLAKYARPVRLGRMYSGGMTADAGLYIGGILIPVVDSKTNIPDFDAMRQAGPRRGPRDGLEVVKLPENNAWRVMRSLGLVGFNPSSKELLLFAESAKTAPGILDFEQVSRTNRFKNAAEKMKEGETEEALYQSLISRAVQGSKRRLKGDRDREQVQAADPGASQMEAAGESTPLGVAGLVQIGLSVCKDTGFCDAPIRTRKGSVQSPEKIWRASAKEYASGKASYSEDGESSNTVLQELASEYGITVDDLSDPVQLREALIDYRNRVQTKLSVKMMPVQTPVDTMEESKALMADLAKLNRGRGRRPRRVRRHLRTNPIERESDLDEVLKYARSEKKERDSGNLPAVFSELGPAAQWELTEGRVTGLLPVRSTEAGSWDPQRRLKTLKTTDFVSRVGRLTGPIVESGRSRASEETVYRMAMPVDDAAVHALVKESATLSLDDALAILRAQGSTLRDARTRSGKETRAMQPSTAICKPYRTRKLSEYKPHSEAVRSLASEALILVSPADHPRPRVMSFRKGAHLDCDMVGANAADLPELLGRAIQSALYWLVEKGTGSRKGSRTSTTNVYLARVGSQEAYLVYRAGSPVSVEAAMSNLERAAKNEAGYRVPLYPKSKNKTASAATDVSDYSEALGGLRAARSTRESPAIVVQEELVQIPEAEEPQRETSEETETLGFESPGEEPFDLGSLELDEETP